MKGARRGGGEREQRERRGSGPVARRAARARAGAAPPPVPTIVGKRARLESWKMLDDGLRGRIFGKRRETASGS